MNPNSAADSGAARPDPVAKPRHGSASVSFLDAIRLLNAAGTALLAQSALHGRLVLVEWAQEKRRLVQMLVFSLLGFACLLCVMLMLAALVLTQSWDTAYRVHAAVGLIAFYALGAEVARRRLHALAAAGAASFAATREELAADIALIRSRL